MRFLKDLSTKYVQTSLMAAICKFPGSFQGFHRSSVAYDAEIVKFAWCKPGQAIAFALVYIAVTCWGPSRWYVQSVTNLVKLVSPIAISRLNSTVTTPVKRC